MSKRSSSILAVSTTALDLTETQAREQAEVARRSFFVAIARKNSGTISEAL